MQSVLIQFVGSNGSRKTIFITAIQAAVSRIRGARTYQIYVYKYPIGIIIRTRKLFDQETLLTLYYTFVYPYLNYCIHVWGKSYNVHNNYLIVLQNKAVRIVYGVSPRRNADKLYFDHNILPLKRLCSHNIGILMHKFSKNMYPELFDIFFSAMLLLYMNMIQDRQV